MRKLILMSLAALALMTSCNKEGEEGLGKNPEAAGSSFLYLNLSGVSSSNNRAAGDPTAGSGQSDVSDVNILLFDANNKFLDIKKLTKVDFAINGNTYQTTNAFQVPAGTAKVFVLINNLKADGTTSRFALPTVANDMGKDWSLLNQTLTYAPQATEDVNAFIQEVTGTRDGNDNYTMVNYGTRAAGDNGLIGVTVGKTADEAKTNGTNNTIYVDRMAAKVEFKTRAAGIEALPQGASFIFQGWEMNATNRTMRLYAEHDPAYTATDVSGLKIAYRKDANYLQSSYGNQQDAWTGYAGQFVFLKNIGTDGTGTTSAVASATGEVKYCPENTMEADAQMIGATTKVIVKGNYVPATSVTGSTFSANDSYFIYMGDYYTLAELKTAYAASVADGGYNQGLAKDMDLFMKGALLVVSAATDSEVETAVASLTEGAATTQLNENTGIIGRVNNAVRYYHKGVNYYSVLIRHDQRITTPMALGRYGTVRNNWYELTLNKVSRPGSPWIPGGPDVPPTDPKPNTPDDMEAYLDVTISINPWVLWSQGIEL